MGTEKETQGHKKMLQYVEDLKRNKRFLRDLSKYKKYSKNIDTAFNNGFYNLIEKYQQLNKNTKKFIKKYEKDFERITSKIAENYGLDRNLLGFITWSMNEKVNRFSNYYEDYLDMCIYDDSNDYSDSDHPDLPMLLNPVRRNHLQAYPVSISIHKFASKRDVLDYIEKKWDSIYNNILSTYTDGKRVRFRKRKLERKIVDFIWNNKNRKVQEIKELLDKEFLGNGLAYYEIHKIIAIEKVRRYE